MVILCIRSHFNQRAAQHSECNAACMYAVSAGQVLLNSCLLLIITRLNKSRPCTGRGGTDTRGPEKVFPFNSSAAAERNLQDGG